MTTKHIYLAASARYAPPGAICAECGCACAGDLVLVSAEYDRLAGRDVVTYRHADAGGCLVARRRSEAYWYSEAPHGSPD